MTDSVVMRSGESETASQSETMSFILFHPNYDYGGKLSINKDLFLGRSLDNTML